MKKLLPYILPVLLFFTSSAFTTDKTEKLIVGKWKADTKAVRKNFEDQFQPSDNPQADAMAKMFIERMLTMMENTTVEYKKGGKYIQTSVDPEGVKEPQILNGTWRLSEDKKSVFITENQKEQKLELVSISKEKLILALPGRTNSGLMLNLIFNSIE